MTEYMHRPAPEQFESDGCTLPWWLNVVTAGLLAWALRPYKSACRWHDWARRHLVYYGVLTVEEADWVFRLYLLDLGAWRWFARAVWLFVKYTRNKYRRTQPVPDQAWLHYVFPNKRRKDDAA